MRAPFPTCMRFLLNPKAAAIAATLAVLSVLLVFNIVTGLNIGPLSATPVHADGNCDVSSDSSSSDSSAADYLTACLQAWTALDDAVSAQSTADANLALTNGLYDLNNSVWLSLIGQKNDVISKCSPGPTRCDHRHAR